MKVEQAAFIVKWFFLLETKVQFYLKIGHWVFMYVQRQIFKNMKLCTHAITIDYSD